MLGIGSFILSAIILTAVLAVCGIVLWLVFGRKKRGEDKVIGGLKLMAHMKATTYMDAMSRRIR